MRDLRLQAIDYKIARIRFYKTIGKVVFLMALITVLALIFIRLDFVLKCQADTLNQIVDLRHEVDEVKDSIQESKKVATIDDFASNTTYSMALTDAELHMVCQVVMSEAMGEPYEGQQAVAQVIRDRAILWGKSVTEIVTAPNQFAKPRQGEISDSVIMAVQSVFDGESVMQFPTTHFHADYVSPYWASKKVSRGTISRHLFYGEELK